MYTNYTDTYFTTYWDSIGKQNYTNGTILAVFFHSHKTRRNSNPTLGGNLENHNPDLKGL